MVGIVDGCLCTCNWCAHGGAFELAPVGVVKLEDVVGHHEFHGGYHHFEEETLWEGALM